MNKHKAFMVLASLVVLAVLMAACAPAATPAATPAPVVVKETVVVEKPVEKVVEKPVEKIKEVVVTATPAPERVTLTMAGFSSTEAAYAVLKNQLERFMKENPNIEVKIQEMPWSSTLQHDMFATWAAGELPVPDIFRLDIIWPAEFGAAGWVVPLNDYIKKAGLDMGDFLEGPLNGCTYQGEVVCLPYFTDAGLLYYRKDLLEKYGFKPPETFAELKEQALTIKEKEGIPNGFVWQGDRYEGLTCDLLEYVWGNGADVLDAQGKVVFDDPKAVEAIGVMVDYIKSGVTPEGVTTYKEEDARGVFQRGDAVFMRNWPYAWSLMNASDSPVRGKVGAKPMVHGPGQKSAACLGGWNLAINKFSQHPDEAFKLIAFLTSAEIQKDTALHAGLSPTRKSLYKDVDVLAANPFWKDFFDIMVGAKPRPVHPRYPEISEALFTEVNKALAGEQDAATAVKNAAKRIEEIVKK